ARAVRAAVGGLGRVVGAAEDRQVRRGWRDAPGVGPTVVTARGLLPLRFRRQAPPLPGAVVARAEPGDFHHRVDLESTVGDPATPNSVDPRVRVVLVVASLAAGRPQAGRV